MRYMYADLYVAILEARWAMIDLKIAKLWPLVTLFTGMMFYFSTDWQISLLCLIPYTHVIPIMRVCMLVT